MLGVGGADEEVVRRPERLRHATEPVRDLVDELLRRHARLLGRPGDVSAVLIGAGQEEDVLAQATVVAGQHVAGDGRVGVTQMRI